RVWTGQDALKIGLVDKIGGLNDAIKAAAILGKTKTYSTVYYPEYEKSFSDLFQQFVPFAQSKQSIIETEIGKQNYDLLQHIKNLSTQKGIQARMMYELKIE
ncbi:MAG: signal peptide peptidase SppA, partial [Flavobacterium sp.]|nr:signal peptide peptidase SppA [Flavobacterium sp.]